MTRELLLDAAARALQRDPDFLALGPERRRDAIAGRADLFGEMRGGADELRRQLVARAEQRGAGVVGVKDDSLALARQFVDKQADALVFGVGGDSDGFAPS